MDKRSCPSVQVVEQTTFRTPQRLGSFPHPLRVAICRTDTPGAALQNGAVPSALHSIFQYTTGGRGVFEDGDQTHYMPQGTGFLKQAGDQRTSSHYPSDGDEPWTFVRVEFGGAADMVREMHLRFGYLYQWPAGSWQMRELLDYARRDSEEFEISNAEGSELVMGILTALVSAADPAPPTPNRGSLVRRAKREIQSHLEKNETAVAEALGVTLDHLSRQWKKDTGECLHDYLIRQRVRRARLLLRRTSLSCTEIARQIGYRQESHFAKVFKEHTGMTPSSFRKKPVLEGK